MAFIVDIGTPTVDIGTPTVDIETPTIEGTVDSLRFVTRIVDSTCVRLIPSDTKYVKLYSGFCAGAK